MDNDLEHKVNMVVGLFVLSSLASTIFYGWHSVIVCIIGLLVLAAILQVLGGGK